MSIISKQVNWGIEENLLYQISKQLDHLIKLSCVCSTTSTTTNSTSSTSTSTTDTTSSTSTSTSTTTETTTSSTTTSTTTTEIPGLKMIFDDIANANSLIAGSSTNVADWNTFFDLPTNGTSFTSVEVAGNVVNLIGGSGIALKDSLFDDAGGYSVSLLSFVDTLGCVVAAGVNVFTGNYYYGCPNLTTVLSPSLLTTGNDCFNGCISLVTVDFSSLITAGDYCFNGCTSLIVINLPVLTNLGTTVGDDGVFSMIIGNTIILTIPIALMTCNDGITTFDPDGDIQYLVSNNTVTIITV